MKRLSILQSLPAVVALALTGCGDFLGEAARGELRWSFDADLPALTKAASEIPDTNDFVLEVLDARGKVLYSGSYGGSPESLLVGAGSYTVTVKSIEFTEPAFARPQYGDTQVVVVSAGETAHARLTCRMLNAGLRLRISSGFMTAYPQGILFVKSADKRLLYSQGEKRIAYFPPGPVSLLLREGADERTLFTRTLAAQEVLSVGISVPGAAARTGGGISVAVDTTRSWRSEEYVVDGGGSSTSGGSAPSDALGVAAAKAAAPAEDVWVYGYIVGGDLSVSGSTVKTGAPFSKDSHLAIAVRSSVTAKISCIAVELKAGTVREALNLVDHPDLVGSRVYLCGDLVESYFGTVGLKNVTDYELK